MLVFFNTESLNERATQFIEENQTRSVEQDYIYHRHAQSRPPKKISDE